MCRSTGACTSRRTGILLNGPFILHTVDQSAESFTWSYFPKVPLSMIHKWPLRVFFNVSSKNTYFTEHNIVTPCYFGASLQWRAKSTFENVWDASWQSLVNGFDVSHHFIVLFIRLWISQLVTLWRSYGIAQCCLNVLKRSMPPCSNGLQ